MTLRILVATRQRLYDLERALGEHGARVTWIDDVAKGLRAHPGQFDVAIIDGSTRSLSLDWAVAELKRRVPGVRLLTVGGSRRADAEHLATLPDPQVLTRELYGLAAPKLDFQEVGARVEWRPLFEVGARIDGHQVDVIGVEDPERFAQFEALAVVLASVPATPTVPRLLKMGRDDERSWAAFAALPGGVSAHALIRSLRHERRGLSPAAVAWLGVAACSALEHLHAHGVRHGWVRCNAVWVADSGEVSLRFPSVGTLIEHDRTLQRRSTIGVAQRWDDLAPETLSGAAETNATDVFQLGHVLYEAATTHSAFSNRPHDRPVRPPALPEPMAQLIVRMLEAEPSRRPAVHEVSAALAPYSDEAPARRELLDARTRLRDLLGI